MLSLLLAAVVLAGPPNAPDTTPDFTVNPVGVQLPPRCDVAQVQPRTLAIVHAFNTGHGATFAKNFTQRPSFQPYTGDIGWKYKKGGLVTRRELMRFVNSRYRAGDGWTVSQLLTPQGMAPPRTRAIYGLRLKVSFPGGGVEGGSKILVSCTSGLVRGWVGPAYSRAHPQPRRVDLYTATRHYFGWYAWNLLELDDRDTALQFGHREGGELVRKTYGHPDAKLVPNRIREAYRDAPAAPVPLLAGARQ